MLKPGKLYKSLDQGRLKRTVYTQESNGIKDLIKMNEIHGGDIFLCIKFLNLLDLIGISKFEILFQDKLGMILVNEKLTHYEFKEISL